MVRETASAPSRIRSACWADDLRCATSLGMVATRYGWNRLVGCASGQSGRVAALPDLLDGWPGMVCALSAVDVETHTRWLLGWTAVWLDDHGRPGWPIRSTEPLEALDAAGKRGDL